MKFIGSAPHFVVESLERSLDFYVGVLEFTRPELWGDPPVFAMPERDGFVVMLNEIASITPSPNGAHGQWDAYFWCENIDAYLERVRSAGAPIAQEPINRELYGMREFEVTDPDGYRLCFAHDIG